MRTFHTKPAMGRTLRRLARSDLNMRIVLICRGQAPSSISLLHSYTEKLTALIADHHSQILLTPKDFTPRSSTSANSLGPPISKTVHPDPQPTTTNYRIPNSPPTNVMAALAVPAVFPYAAGVAIFVPLGVIAYGIAEIFLDKKNRDHWRARRALDGTDLDGLLDGTAHLDDPARLGDLGVARWGSPPPLPAWDAAVHAAIQQGMSHNTVANFSDRVADVLRARNVSADGTNIVIVKGEEPGSVAVYGVGLRAHGGRRQTHPGTAMMEAIARSRNPLTEDGASGGNVTVGRYLDPEGAPVDKWDFGSLETGEDYLWAMREAEVRFWEVDEGELRSV